MFLFNNDSGIIVAAIIVGGIFTYTLYNNIWSTNTNTPSNLIYKEVGVQTDSLINTQLSMDSISEFPESTYPCIQPNILPDKFHVEAEVQTSYNSLWELFKDWVWEKYNVLSGSIARTPTEVKVVKWLDNLDPSQSTPSVDVNSVVSESHLQQLVSVYDINDYVGYCNVICQPNAFFNHMVVDSVHQYFIHINDAILTVNPEIINSFIACGI